MNLLSEWPQGHAFFANKVVDRFLAQAREIQLVVRLDFWLRAARIDRQGASDIIAARMILTSRKSHRKQKQASA
jgi:hypothetical protein